MMSSCLPQAAALRLRRDDRAATVAAIRASTSPLAIASSLPTSIHEEIQRPRPARDGALPMNPTIARAAWIKSKHLFVSDRPFDGNDQIIQWGVLLARRLLLKICWMNFKVCTRGF
jgi:hypothetical protein